ncbi:MAG: hypothetical protein K2X66_17260, partial [Cyanobacteria bacterium]|nr:hypothetical protein [Cyanobacteriota bacterium]
MMLHSNTVENLADLEGWVDTCNEIYCQGWVHHTHETHQPLFVDIYLENVRLATIPARSYHPGLREMGKGDGNKGFLYFFPSDIGSTTPQTISLKFANTDKHIPGSPFSILFPQKESLSPLQKVENIEQFARTLQRVLNQLTPWGYIQEIKSDETTTTFEGWVLPPPELKNSLGFMLNSTPFDSVEYPLPSSGIGDLYWFLPEGNHVG